MELLIDLDPIVYRIGFATQKTVREVWKKDGVPDRWGGEPLESFTTKADMDKWVKDNPTIEVEVVNRLEADPLPYALHSCKMYINKAIKKTEASSYRGFLTGKGNFRERIVPDYKGNRVGTDKPIHYQALRDYMVKHFRAEVIQGKEADDQLGLCQTEETMIATIDKDLDIVAGMHFNYVTEKFYVVTPEEGIKNFYGQMLTGDSVDYIAGIKGVGKDTAFKWLEQAPRESWDDLIEEKYREFHLKAVKKVATMSDEDKKEHKNHDFVAFDRDGWFKTMVQNTQLLWMLQTDVKMPMDIKGDL